jgi:hypothetical protein
MKFATAGTRTSEWWLTIATIVAIVVLALAGKADGATLGAIAAASTGYSVSRGLYKSGTATQDEGVS